MSTLYASERGFAIPTASEELTFDRRVRKTFDLPATTGPGRLFILARCYPGNRQPLHVTCNDLALTPIEPADPASDAGYLWIEASIPPNALRAGRNVVDLWVDADAMNAWSIAVDYGGPSSWSEASDDAGATWSSDHLGYLHFGCGEYVIRIRLPEGEDPPPPPFIREDSDHRRLGRLRELLPAEILAPAPTLDRVRALATWTSTRWKYRNEKQATQYAPWDPATIIAWGRTGSGHDGRLPIVMCIHYAVTFVGACLTLGIEARFVVLAHHINSPMGHFAAEVWVPELDKWVFIDPNEDAIFVRDQVPLSTREIRTATEPLADLVAWGPGHTYQARTASMRDWIANAYLTGACFRYGAVWPRTDFFSRPERTPPFHGATAYSELDLVWESPPADTADFGMFRYFAPRAWFDEPPPYFAGGPTPGLSR